MDATTTTTTKEWLSPDELEAEYGLPKSTQAKYRMRGILPYSKIGTKIVRYNRAKVNAWLDSLTMTES